MIDVSCRAKLCALFRLGERSQLDVVLPLKIRRTKEKVDEQFRRRVEPDTDEDARRADVVVELQTSAEYKNPTYRIISVPL